MPSWESTSATTKTKRSAQGAQELGHPPRAVSQDVRVSGQMNQLDLQPSRAEEGVHESHQLVTSVPFLMIQKMKLPGQEGKTSVIVGDYN